MKFSEQYGAQLDESDGTIGTLKLVRRFVIFDEDNQVMWQARQGRHTYQSRSEVERHIELFKKNNPPDSIPNLSAKEFWCYPGHFDPVCQIQQPTKES